MARIVPAQAPYTDAVRGFLERTMPPGIPPLVLFTTLARDERLFGRFSAAALLDRGHLTLRQRELVIGRTTARCASEYEWGVHATFFGARAGFDEAQLSALVHGTSDATIWSHDERTLLRVCDSLHERVDIDDALWAELRAAYAEEAIIEVLMLAGFYRTVSYLTNALRLDLEPTAMRFPGAPAHEAHA
jgi:alkylhydroperoxidase family enzyme